MHSLFAGIDIGTTSTKVVIINVDGKPIHQTSRGYPLLSSSPGYAEQDPDQVVEAVIEAFAEAIAGLKDIEPLAGVGFSSAMHSLLLLDSHHEPLTPLITWADTRSEAIAANLRPTSAGHAIYSATGTPVHPMTPLCKLAWIKQFEPDLLTLAAHVVSIKEYVFLRLFGVLVVDHSLASATGLFDIVNRIWYEPALEFAGISADRLSTPVSTSYRLPSMLSDMTARIGIGKDVAFFAGASDGCLANLGVQAMHPNEAALTIGTSGAVRVTVSDPVADPERRLFTYILDDRHYVTGGAINNGGILVQWFRERFTDGNESQFVTLMEEAAALSPGSDGLLCIPYLLGERAPHWNSFDRGVFFGVRLEHTRAHFLRAMLEGAALTLRQILLAIEELYEPVEVVYANGGFVKSAFWVQLIADVLNRPVVISSVGEASAIGAAMMAGRASGNQIPTGTFELPGQDLTRFEPDAQAHAVYRTAAGLFSDLYETLHPQFEKLQPLTPASSA